MKNEIEQGDVVTVNHLPHLKGVNFWVRSIRNGTYNIVTCGGYLLVKRHQINHERFIVGLKYAYLERV